MSRRRLRRLIPIDCSATGLILPRRHAAARDGRIAAIVGLEGRVGAAGSADAADVGLALRKGVKAAVGAPSGVAGTPCSVGAGMRGGDGHCGQTDRGGEYDSPHGNLLGDGHPPVPFSGGASVEVRTDLRDQHRSAGVAAAAHLERPQKNRAGPRPCSEKRKSTKPYAELTPRISVICRDGCGFAPPCPPKTWTARSSALQDRLAP